MSSPETLFDSPVLIRYKDGTRKIVYSTPEGPWLHKLSEDQTIEYAIEMPYTYCIFLWRANAPPQIIH